MKHLSSSKMPFLSIAGALQLVFLAMQQVQAQGGGATGGADGAMESMPTVLLVVAAGAGLAVLGWRYWKGRQG